MDIVALLLLSILPVMVIVAALTDVTSMTIPNWISLVLIAAFAPAALVAGLGPVEIGLHVAIGLGALMLGIALFALNLLGGGDAKLMAAASLWLGLDATLVFILATAVTGGLFSLALLVVRNAGAPLAAAGPAWMGRLLQPKGDIPYGVAIAVGVLFAYPHSAIMAAFAGA